MHEEPPLVCCVRCGQHHEGFNTGQANDCAGEIRSGAITGSHGSAVADMTVLEPVPGACLDLPDGDICDCCILDLQRAGPIRNTADDA